MVGHGNRLMLGGGGGGSGRRAKKAIHVRGLMNGIRFHARGEICWNTLFTASVLVVPNGGRAQSASGGSRVLVNRRGGRADGDSPLDDIYELVLSEE